MTLLPKKGEILPKVPQSLIKLTPEGAWVIETFGGTSYYLLDCGHRISVDSVDLVTAIFGSVPCLRCYEDLLGTVDAE